MEATQHDGSARFPDDRDEPEAEVELDAIEDEEDTRDLDEDEVEELVLDDLAAMEGPDA